MHNWPDLWMEAGYMAVNAIIFDYSKAQNYKSRDFCLQLNLPTTINLNRNDLSIYNVKVRINGDL